MPKILPLLDFSNSKIQKFRSTASRGRPQKSSLAVDSHPLVGTSSIPTKFKSPVVPNHESSLITVMTSSSSHRDPNASVSNSLTAAAVGVVCGSALTLAVSSWLESKRRRTSTTGKRHHLPESSGTTNFNNNSINNSNHHDTTATTTPRHDRIPPELRQEQISRHTLYFGQAGMQALQQARICVVGVGGVGSHAATALARSGLGYLRLVDFDVVSLSSLNRHACAGLADVGRPKVHVLTEYLQRVCPDERYLQLHPVNEMYTVDGGAAQILDDHPTSGNHNNNNNNNNNNNQWTMVIDAIDDVPTKAQLIADCYARKIRVVSCMGAGGKADVTRLHVSDLRAASRDPLATKLRQHLKRLLPADDLETLMDDMHQLTILFSSEKTVVGLADFTEEQKQEGVHTFGAVDGMRIRILPVLATMPAVMGQGLAAVALTEIGGKALSPVTGERVGRSVRHKLLQKLRTRENRFAKEHGAQLSDLDQVSHQGGRRLLDKDEEDGGLWIGPVDIDDMDVEYMLEIWRNRCSITQQRLGTVLELIRWDPSKPGTCDNLVLLSNKAMKEFEKSGREGVDPLVRQRIEARLATCRLDAYTLRNDSKKNGTVRSTLYPSSDETLTKEPEQKQPLPQQNEKESGASTVQSVTTTSKNVATLDAEVFHSKATSEEANAVATTSKKAQEPQSTPRDLEQNVVENSGDNTTQNGVDQEPPSNINKPKVIVRRRRRKKAEEKKPVVDPVLLDKVLRDSSLPSAYTFEIVKSVERILELQASHVALQMPEGLLMYATVLADIFRRLAPCCTQVSVLGDVTYGACCIDDLGAEALGANLLVHYGHSCLVPLQHTTIPCLYVFVEIQLDVPHLIDCVDVSVSETDSAAKPLVYLLGTVQFRHALASAKRLLQERGYEHVVIPQAKPLSPGEVLGCTSPRLVQHQELKVEKAIVCFLADGRFHLESTLISNANNGIQTFYRYDPYSKTLTEEAYDHSAMYGLRKHAIQNAASAKTFGILMGTLGRQGNPAIVQRIRQSLNQHGKRHFLMLVSEITPAKLKLFGQKVDAWIQVACPRLSVDWGHHLANKPVLSPYELFVSLEETSWQSEYPMDFYSHSGGPWSNYYEENRERRYKQVTQA